MADVKIGVLFLLTAVLQSFVGRNMAGIIIRFEEDVLNHSFHINESSGDYQDYYYGNFSYFNETYIVDYSLYETISAKGPNSSTGALHPCHCFLFFVTLLHTLPVLLRVLCG